MKKGGYSLFILLILVSCSNEVTTIYFSKSAMKRGSQIRYAEQVSGKFQIKDSLITISRNEHPMVYYFKINSKSKTKTGFIYLINENTIGIKSIEVYSKDSLAMTGYESTSFYK